MRCVIFIKTLKLNNFILRGMYMKTQVKFLFALLLSVSFVGVASAIDAGTPAAAETEAAAAESAAAAAAANSYSKAIVGRCTAARAWVAEHPKTAGAVGVVAAVGAVSLASDRVRGAEAGLLAGALRTVGLRK